MRLLIGPSAHIEARRCAARSAAGRARSSAGPPTTSCRSKPTTRRSSSSSTRTVRRGVRRKADGMKRMRLAMGAGLTPGTGLTPPIGTGIGLGGPHLHRDWAPPGHVCNRVGLAPAAAHICIGTAHVCAVPQAWSTSTIGRPRSDCYRRTPTRSSRSRLRNGRSSRPRPTA